MINKKVYATALSLGAILGVLGTNFQAQASQYKGICCSQQVEVAITPFNLVTGAYQGRFVDQGISSFGVFDQQVATGEITGKDLVRAAYMEYRATYEDLSGETSLIKDVDNFLDSYRKDNN